jgi:predicted HD phosphohydrolase
VIDRFLTGNVLLERRTSSDAFNGNSYAPGVFVRARFHSEAVVVRSYDGREVTSNAHVSVVTEIAPGDRVTDEIGRAHV